MHAPPVYHLEKWLWTEADFDVMGWHDTSVYAWRLQAQELLLDIDYIFQWNRPEVEGASFTFWVAPATLVFHRVRNIEFAFEGGGSWEAAVLEIDDIKQTAGKWIIRFQNGYFGFIAAGFTQYIRWAPSFEFGQQVSDPKRIRSSFERTTGETQTDPFDFVEFRKTDTWRLYQVSLDYVRVRRQLEQLLAERAGGNITLREFLLLKHDLQNRRQQLKAELQGTQFALV